MAEDNSSSSLKRLMSILDIFTESHPEWSSENMMARLGYARPTLYRYLKILTDSGMLTSSAHGIYTLGPKIVEMDHLIRISDRLIVIGTPLVEHLASRFACTAFLVRWYRDRILCVHSETSLANPLSSYPRGRVMDMKKGAISRVILAHLHSNKTRAILESFSPKESVEASKAYVTHQMSLLRTVRRDGFAIAFSEVTPGATAVASPIFGEAKEPVGALCVTMRQEDCPHDVQTIITRTVPDAAETITTALREAHRASKTRQNPEPKRKETTNEK